MRSLFFPIHFKRNERPRPTQVILAAVLAGFVCTANICGSADEIVKLSSSAASGTLRAAGKSPTDITLSRGQLSSLGSKHGIDAESLASTAPKMEQVSRWSQFNSIVQDLRSTVTDPDGLGAAIKIGCAPFDDPPKDLTQVEFEVQPEYEHLTFREQQKVLASGRSLYRAVVTSKENPNKDIQSSAFWFCLAHSALG